MTPDEGTDAPGAGSEAARRVLDPAALPWLTLAVAAAVAAVFAVQLRVAPGFCVEFPAYPAVCPVTGLLDRSLLAVAVLPLVHGTVGHLATNVGFLLFFGSYFEHRHGRRRYLALLAVAGYGAVLVQLVVDVLAGRPPLALGLSGAVYAVAAAPAVADLPRSLPERSGDRADVVGSVLRVAFSVGGWAVVLRAVASHVGVLHTAPTTATGVHVVGVVVGLGYGLVERTGVARTATDERSADPY